MSYSCTNRGNSQDPSSAKKAAGNNPSRDTGGTDSSPKQTATMKVKKGCNSEVGVPVTTEEDLLTSAVVTPEDVLGLQKITESKFTAIVSVDACQRRTKVRKTPWLVSRHYMCGL